MCVCVCVCVCVCTHEMHIILCDYNCSVIFSLEILNLYWDSLLVRCASNCSSRNSWQTQYIYISIYLYIYISLYIYGVGTAMAAARRHEGGECFQRGTSCSTESRAAMVAVG